MVDGIRADSYRDTQEMGCGDLIIALRKAIRPLEPGQVLEIRATDAGASEDIPAWCRLTRHELLAGPCGPDNAHYFIRKRRTDPSPRTG